MKNEDVLSAAQKVGLVADASTLIAFLAEIKAIRRNFVLREKRAYGTNSKERFKTWRRENKEIVNARQAAWVKAHPENRARSVKAYAESDKYVLNILKRTIKGDIPQELIEAKRTHLKMMRELREKP